MHMQWNAGGASNARCMQTGTHAAHSRCASCMPPGLGSPKHLCKSGRAINVHSILKALTSKVLLPGQTLVRRGMLTCNMQSKY